MEITVERGEAKVQKDLAKLAKEEHAKLKGLLPEKKNSTNLWDLFQQVNMTPP